MLSLILALISSWAFSRFLLSDLLSELDCSQHHVMLHIIISLSWNQQSPLKPAGESSGNVFVYVWHCCQYALCSYYRQAVTSYFYAAGTSLCYTDMCLTLSIHKCTSLKLPSWSNSYVKFSTIAIKYINLRGFNNNKKIIHYCKLLSMRE